MTILEILNQIENESSTNKKLEILKQHQDNELLKQICYLTYNKLISFYIKKIPEYSTLPFTSVELSLDTLSQLSKLYNRETTGNLAIEHLEFLLSTLDEDSAEVIKRIIKRDLKCNIGSTQINKVWKDLIPKFPYMRISLFKDIKPNTIIWKNGVYSQLKEDSMFANLNYDLEGNITLYSRNGTELPIARFMNIVRFAQEFLEKGYQYNGELMVKSEGEYLPREISNGILNSVSKGGFFDDLSYPVYHIWDSVPLSVLESKCKYNVPYLDRYSMLLELFKKTEKFSGEEDGWQDIELVETRICYSIDEVIEHYVDVRKRGLEGLVIKLPDAIWRDGTNKQMFKLKQVVDVDLKIIGYNEGNGKNKDTFGSLICESSDGLLEVCVSGFTDEKRLEIYNNMDNYIGRIITVKGNNVSPPTKNNLKYSIFLPQFLEIREDKDNADTLEEIQAQFESSILTIRDLLEV